MNVRADGAARHRKTDHARIRRGRDRVEVVILESFVEEVLDLVHLVGVDVEGIARAFEGVGHGTHVGLHRARRHRTHG